MRNYIRRASVKTAQATLVKLSADQLRQIDAWLHARIDDLESEQIGIPVKLGREVVEQRKEGSKTFQLEKVKCGKEKCKCTKGNLHGPYWYAYWSEKGKTKSAYVGKKLSKEACQSGK